MSHLQPGLHIQQRLSNLVPLQDMALDTSLLASNSLDRNCTLARVQPPDVTGLVWKEGGHETSQTERPSPHEAEEVPIYEHGRENTPITHLQLARGSFGAVPIP